MFAKVFVRLGEDFKIWRETGDASGRCVCWLLDTGSDMNHT